MPPNSDESSSHHISPAGVGRSLVTEPGKIHIEPTPIHFRILTTAQEAGEHFDTDTNDILMQSRRAFLIWEMGSPFPALAFLRQDTKFASQEEGRQGFGLGAHQRQADEKLPSKTAAEFFDLYLGQGEPNSRLAAWSFARDTPTTDRTSPTAHSPDQLIVIDTSKFPEVWQEDARMIGHVKNPYHRVDAIPSTRHVQVFVRSQDGQSEYLLADTSELASQTPKQVAYALFETGLPTRYYLPSQAFKQGALAGTSLSPPVGAQEPDFPADGLTTVCPYKGYARYHAIRLPDGEELANLVWSYPRPIPDFDLRNTVALWTPGHKRLRLVVDGSEVV